MDIPDVDKFDVALGSIKGLPDYDTIPKEFKNGHTKWNKLFNEWFFLGLKKIEFKPKDGVDLDKAFKHIRSIMTSWKPKHEHKEAAVSYLMSEYFKDVEWEVADKK